MLSSLSDIHFVDCLDSLLCTWSYEVIVFGSNLLLFGTLAKWSAQDQHFGYLQLAKTYRLFLIFDNFYHSVLSSSNITK